MAVTTEHENSLNPPSGVCRQTSYSPHVKRSRSRCKPRRNSRKGMLTLEFVLIAPLLLILVLAGVEFAIWLMATQAVSAAASVGARAASVTDATLATVESAVQHVLEDWKFADAIDPVTIKVSNELGEQSNDLADAQTGDMVKVTVSVDVVQAVPDLLELFGVSLSGEKIAAACVARKE